MAKCINCGGESGKYALCFKCNRLKEEGKIIKCENCGKWHDASKPCDCKKTTSIVKAKPQENKNVEGVCVICGKNAPNGPLCYECFKKKEAEKAEFMGKRSKQEALDHYFNQRNCIFKIKNPEYMENGAIRMFAIAEELALYKENYLKDRVVDDVKALMERKKVKKEKQKKKDNISVVSNSDATEKQSKSFDDVDYRKQWAAEHQCDDGHYVRSYSELLIDNWLYNNGYRHAYEKSVFICTEPDAVVLSDFYIPDGNVYIEFWGLNDDQRYLKRKEKKLKMYKDNNLNLISLEEADVKRLNDILPRKLFDYIKK